MPRQTNSDPGAESGPQYNFSGSWYDFYDLTIKMFAQFHPQKSPMILRNKKNIALILHVLFGLCV